MPSTRGERRNLADITSVQWPASNRYGWPASNRKTWPASSESAGGELRLGTTSMYMTTYITILGANQNININLHGYILGGKCKLIAQNQALERVNRGKFRLEGRQSQNSRALNSSTRGGSCSRW